MRKIISSIFNIFGDKKDKSKPNARIVDLKAMEYNLPEYINELPQGSISRRYNGTRYHLLVRDLKGKIDKFPVPEFKVVDGETPEDLYQAMTPDESDTEIVYGLENPPWYKSESLPYLIIISVCIFVMFIMFFGVG